MNKKLFLGILPLFLLISGVLAYTPEIVSADKSLYVKTNMTSLATGGLETDSYSIYPIQDLSTLRSFVYRHCVDITTQNIGNKSIILLNDLGFCHKTGQEVESDMSNTLIAAVSAGIPEVTGHSSSGSSYGSLLSLITPKGGETLSGIVDFMYKYGKNIKNIAWYASGEVTGNKMVLLDTLKAGEKVTIDTNTVPDGDYKIKIVGKNLKGKAVAGDNSGTFSVKNSGP